MNPDLDRLFDYHPPNDETKTLHAGVRADMKDFAKMILDYLPDGRETVELTDSQASSEISARRARRSLS